MAKSRFLILLTRCSILAALLGCALLFSLGSARADEPKGQLKTDLVVGDAHDIHLKAGQVVQILNNSGDKLVIMAQLPDGSSGIYQIDPAAVALLTANAPPPPTPSPAIVTTPAPPNPAPVGPAPPPTAAPVNPPPQPPAAETTEPATPPTYPDDFVGGPEFDTTAGQQAAGTASVIKLKDGDQSYIVSARHLLGPEGGFKVQTPAKDVPSFVQAIRIHSFSGGDQHYDVTGLLVPSERLKPIGGAPIDDMAIYQNHDTSPQTQAVALADQVPAVGTPLWVVAHVRGGVPEGQVMQSGKVTENTTWIILQFDNDNIITAGASGAPVLNAAGEVVGVYSGHSKEKGHVFGFIIPSTLIAKVIKDAPALTP